MTNVHSAGADHLSSSRTVSGMRRQLQLLEQYAALSGELHCLEEALDGSPAVPPLPGLQSEPPILAPAATSEWPRAVEQLVGGAASARWRAGLDSSAIAAADERALQLVKLGSAAALATSGGTTSGHLRQHHHPQLAPGPLSGAVLSAATPPPYHPRSAAAHRRSSATGTGSAAAAAAAAGAGPQRASAMLWKGAQADLLSLDDTDLQPS